MTTITHWKIDIDTMNQCVSSLAGPKKTMHMLADELDRGATTMHPVAMEVRVHFSKMSLIREDSVDSIAHVIKYRH